MYRELGLLLVLCLPVLLIYFARSNVDSHRSNATVEPSRSKKKSKKKKSKGSQRAVTHTTDMPRSPSPVQATQSEVTPQSNDKSPSQKHHASANRAKNKPTTSPVSSPSTPVAHASPKSPSAPSSSTPSLPSREHEVDEHMDLTPKVARVMRITTEVPNELEPVPYEPGWHQVAVTHKSVPSGSSVQEPLTKKQRENQARASKRKEEKAAAAALQEMRLRKHQQELERERIRAFYATNKPKNGSRKTPTATAALNEHGQLIWD